jgi:hypothetical protein
MKVSYFARFAWIRDTTGLEKYFSRPRWEAGNLQDGLEVARIEGKPCLKAGSTLCPMIT